MKTSGSLKITTPTDREIVMTRVFDAPRTLVWDAMSKPDLIKRWLFGPPGWWEVEKTPWGAPLEATSAAKAEAYLAAYTCVRRRIRGQERCESLHPPEHGDVIDLDPTLGEQLLHIAI